MVAYSRTIASGLARTASTVLVLALLGGTAAAFAVTEGLKLERSPIAGTRVDKVFSPVCRCPSRVAKVAFRLRKADHLTVAIVGVDGAVARTIVDSRPTARGMVHFVWNGRDDAGRVVPVGTYKPRVHLDEQHRTIVLPNPIRVDTTPPRVLLVGVKPRVFSPDGDGRADRVRVRYRLSEPAHALLIVDRKQLVRTRRRSETGAVEWNGRLAGRSPRAGAYRVALAAEDPAGNVSAPAASVPVRIRYIALAREVIRGRARTRIGVRVDTDARSYRWKLAGRSGRSRAPLLVFRAPRPGRYTLYVEAGGHADRALVIVEPRR